MNNEELKAKIRYFLNHLTSVENSQGKFEIGLFIVDKKQELILLLDCLKCFLKQRDIDTSLNTLPDTGQLLGRLCCLKIVIGDEQLYKSLISCIMCLYKETPLTQLERKAKDWVLAQLKSTVCMSEKKNYIVCKLGIKRSAALTEHSRLILKNISGILNRKIQEIQKQKCGIQSYPPYYSLDDQPMIKSVILIILSLPYTKELSLLWENIMEILTNYRSDEPTVHRVYERLTSIQKELYSSKDIGLKLTRACCRYLWTSYLPSLEVEVLQILREASSHSLPSHMKEALLKSHLVILCAEYHHIHITVNQMLHTLLTKSEGSSTVADVLSLLNQCVHQYIYHSHDPVSSIHSLCWRYPVNIHCLINQLLVQPADLKINEAGHHIELICKNLSDLNTDNNYSISDLCLLHFKQWYTKAVQICLICDRKYVGGCLQLISCFLCRHLTEQIALKNQLKGLVLCLRPLLVKTSLGLTDIQYALNSSQSNTEDKRTVIVIRQILLSFMFLASSGIQLSNDLLKMATESDEPFQHLYVLLMAHENLCIDFTEWSPYKLQGYVTFIEYLQTTVYKQLTELSQTFINVSEIIGATNNFLLSMKKMCNHKKLTQ